MQRVILISGILAVLGTPGIQAAAQSPLKIGYINSQVIIAEGPCCYRRSGAVPAGDGASRK